MKSIKSKVLVSLLAFALAVTSIATPSVSAEAASSKKAVKSVTLKVNNKKVNSKTTTLQVGKTLTVKTTVSPSSAKKSISYKTSNKKIATVSSKGKVKAVKAGTAKITVTVKGKNNKKKTAWFKVKVTKKATPTKAPTNAPTKTPTATPDKVEVKSVVVSVNPAVIKVGEKAQVTANVQPANATNKGFTYTSSNPSVAKVDKSGVVSGVAGGTTTITATATNGVSGSVSITVEETEVESVVLDKTTLTLAKGAKGKLTASVLPTTAKNKKVSWSSDNIAVATVSNDGEISALTPGTANITVTTDEGKRTAVCVVTVTNTTNENVDGLSAEVTNPMNDEHPGVVLTGTSAYIQVRLANAGKPVGGSSVELTYEAKYGNAPDYFELKENSVKETNSDGIVTYVFGLKDQYSKLTATDDIYQSYRITITAVGSNQKIDIPVSFACIEFNDIYVRNNIDPSLTDITPGSNVIDSDGLYTTKSTNGYKNWEYVTSQQESLTDTTEHEVHIAAIPYLILPAIEGETTTEFYEKIQHSASAEYSVYNDETNTTTTTVVTDVPAGLNYITLHFSKIELSEYTRMKIQLIDADNGTVYDTIYKDVTNNILDAGVQIEIQENEEIDVVISLESAGQVNDDKNEGYVLEKVTGLWKSSGLERRTEEELVNSVKWSVVDAVYSDPQVMSYETAKQYIKVDANTSQKEILKETNTYSYRVPSFPNSGDAIITVKDENGKEIAYYLYPSENSWEWAKDNFGNYILDANGNKIQKWLNVNVLSAPGSEGYAIYATADEVTAKVGELKQEGNVAIVNSNAPGRTHLKAVLSIPELGQIDATNGAVGYTSVQWAPRPKEEEVIEQKDFYALIGQTIEVEAQLYSANGNKYTGSEVPIEFFYEYADETKIPASGKSIDDKDIVTVINNPTKTDTNGHAVLQVKASQADEGKLIGVWAKSKAEDGKTYDVRLTVKGTETEVANLYWVDAGLSFKDRMQYDQVSDGEDGKTTVALSDTVEVRGLLPRTVGSHWIFGYQLIGALDRNDYEVGKISGINIDVQKENVGEDLEPYTVAGVAQNGVVRAYSEQTGSTTIIGTVNDEQINKEVVFSIYDKVTHEKIGDFVNVGVGTSTINATLRLPFAWTNLGLARKIITPLGTQLNQETATNAYIQVTDQYGNVYKDKEVEYWTISTTGAASHVIGSEENRKTATTDSNGLVKIELPAPNAAGATTIYAMVNGERVVGTITYQNQTDKTKKDFALVNAVYKPASADENLTNDQIVLTFSNRIDEKTLDVKMFDVFKADDEAISYTIKSAELDSSNKKVVILTMANTTLQSVQDKIKVRVSEYTPEEGAEAGVEKELVDVYGATVEPAYNEVITQPNAAYTINASYDNGVITAVVKRGNTTITTLDGKIYAVSEIASVLNNATGVIASSSRIIPVTPASQTTKITLYYMGASTTIDIASTEVNAPAEEEVVEEEVATAEATVEEEVAPVEATVEEEVATAEATVEEETAEDTTEEVSEAEEAVEE